MIRFPAHGAPFDLLRELWAAPRTRWVNPYTYPALTHHGRSAIRMALLRLRRSGWEIEQREIRMMAQSSLDRVLGGVKPGSKHNLAVIRVRPEQRKEVHSFLRSPASTAADIARATALGMMRAGKK